MKNESIDILCIEGYTGGALKKFFRKSMKKRTFTIDENTTRIALVANVFYQTIGAILLPLVIFAGGGWLMDRTFETGRFFLFSGVAMAFVATQAVVFLKVRTFSSDIDGISRKEKQKTEKGE